MESKHWSETKRLSEISSTSRSPCYPNQLKKLLCALSFLGSFIWLFIGSHLTDTTSLLGWILWALFVVAPYLTMNFGGAYAYRKVSEGER